VSAPEVGTPAPGSNPGGVHGLVHAQRAVRLPRPGRVAVRRLGALVLVAVLLAAGYAWLRDSSLVRVRDVVVTGVSSSQEARVREALRATATDMTTLHVREDELRAAVAPYTSVASLRIETRFPHGISIEVVERRPAGVVQAGGQRVPVSAGGLLLRGVRPEAGLPVVRIDTLPVGARLTDRRARAAVAILAGAPGAMAGRLERARSSDQGLVVELRDGPDVIFGSAARVRAKWAAATRVLADSESRGGTYVDVRVPEWTAVGGVGPVDPTDQGVPAPGDQTNPLP
jgi:cell division protein FtsQ